jgi:hypothetical protein
MKAYCFQSGHIAFGARVPEGALLIAKAPPKVLRPIIEALARLSRTDNKTMFVPGVPEADNDTKRLNALSEFCRRVTQRISWHKDAKATERRKRRKAVRA